MNVFVHFSTSYILGSIKKRLTSKFSFNYIHVFNNLMIIMKSEHDTYFYGVGTFYKMDCDVLGSEIKK